MRLTTSLCFILLASCALYLPALLAGDAEPKNPAQDDLKLLQGSWKVVALEIDGVKAKPEGLQGGRWAFKDSVVRCADPGQELRVWASVKLDPSKTPKHIDFLDLEGPRKGKMSQGIFKWDRGRLVICFRYRESAEGRPREFRTEADSYLGMITLERGKE
jgi:uncharacterized protein (TIGR03067 family)